MLFDVRRTCITVCTAIVCRFYAKVKNCAHWQNFYIMHIKLEIVKKNLSLSTSFSLCCRRNTVPEEAHVFACRLIWLYNSHPPTYHSFFLTSLLVFLLSMVQHVYASLGGGGFGDGAQSTYK
jgi:hypothetical protein